MMKFKFKFASNANLVQNVNLILYMDVETTEETRFKTSGLLNFDIPTPGGISKA